MGAPGVVGSSLAALVLLVLGSLALAQTGLFAAPTLAATPRPTSAAGSQAPTASRWTEGSALPAGRTGCRRSGI